MWQIAKLQFSDYKDVNFVRFGRRRRSILFLILCTFSGLYALLLWYRGKGLQLVKAAHGEKDTRFILADNLVSPSNDRAVYSQYQARLLRAKNATYTRAKIQALGNDRTLNSTVMDDLDTDVPAIQALLENSNHYLLNIHSVPIQNFLRPFWTLNAAEYQKLSSEAKDEPITCKLEDSARFPDQSRLTPTVMTSFPRSGNSWLRSLIEKSTTFTTSSLYCDKHLLNRFKGECDKDNRFLAKLHYPHNLDTMEQLNVTESRWVRWKRFGKCLYTIRNPFDTFLSYFMYRFAHGLHDIKKNDLPLQYLTLRRIRRMTYRYKLHYLYWKENSQLPNLAIRYEDLSENPFPQLFKAYLFLLDEFIDFSPLHLASSLAHIERRVNCSILDDVLHPDGLVYQTNKYKMGHSLGYFTPDAIAYIKSELEEPMQRFGYYQMVQQPYLLNINHTFIDK